MSDKKMYQLEVLYTSSWGNEVTYRFHVLAESKWEAIERAVTRYRELQPDRSYYKVISGGWSRETAQTICFLAVSAVNYTMNYS